MIQTKSWKITDEFWEEVKDLIPEKQRDPNKEYKWAAGGDRPPMDSRKVLETIFYVLRTGKIQNLNDLSNAITKLVMKADKQGSFNDRWSG